MSETLQAHRLCRFCSWRQGTAAGLTVVPGPDCELCEGVMDMVPEMGKLAMKRMRGYEFVTFTVGVSLPGRLQEKEDELRSSLRLKGGETIKGQAARLVGDVLSTLTGKRHDRMNADLMVLANLETHEVVVTSRPLYYYARYSKPRGIAQRRSFCEFCRGKGCPECGWVGFERKPSVEDALRKKLSEFSGSTKIIFTWIGSEDSESAVLSPGRPFVVEIKNPRKRTLPVKFATRTGSGLLTITGGKPLPAKPVQLPSFRFQTKIRATAAAKVDLESLRRLKLAFRNTQVTFRRPSGRPTTKTVYWASATCRGKSLVISAELDGGLPVKRFVSGELVSPSVTEVLKTEVRCRSFDIVKVKEIGAFGFAKIPRNTEKN